MKIALIDSSTSRPWHDCGHRLDYLVPALQAYGHEVIRLDAAQTSDRLPIIAGAHREGDIKPLVEAVRLFTIVRNLAPEACIAPLAGGLAHGLLMARGCGELPATTKVFLVAEKPSRAAALLDKSDNPLRALVADAMERFCLAQGDALLCTSDDPLAWILDLSIEDPGPIARCLPAPMRENMIVATSKDPRELFFVGPFLRSHGVVAFVDAAERLLVSDRTSLKRVTFCGPINERFKAVGKEWLGLRAQKWPFAFRVVETTSLSEAINLVMAEESLALFSGSHSSIARTIIERADRSATIADEDIMNAAALFDRLASTAAPDIRSLNPPESTPGLEGLTDLPLRHQSMGSPDSKTRLSICILHYERPHFLRDAIASVVRQIDDTMREHCEVLIFDNGSVGRDSVQMLEKIADTAGLVVVLQAPSLPHTAAMNAMASHATGSHLVFLDDDNLLADHGLAALFDACAAQRFDIVTSNLYVFDGHDPNPRSVALMAFIGPAFTAGLFFNGFGDTCMAIRRGVFDALGGFLEAGGPVSAPDWLLLARAQAKHFAIGVLQEPAFLYRRDIAKADVNAQKYDQHGLRARLLAHYGDQFDPALVVSLAQAQMIG